MGELETQLKEKNGERASTSALTAQAANQVRQRANGRRRIHRRRVQAKEYMKLLDENKALKADVSRLTDKLTQKSPTAKKDD